LSSGTVGERKPTVTGYSPGSPGKGRERRWQW